MEIKSCHFKNANQTTEIEIKALLENNVRWFNFTESQISSRAMQILRQKQKSDSTIKLFVVCENRSVFWQADGIKILPIKVEGDPDSEILEYLSRYCDLSA